jgi:hypothetical protein
MPLFPASSSSLPAIHSSTLNKLFKILIGLFVLIAALLLIRPKPRTVIFGFFAGECVGNCGTMYQVSEKVIARDTTSFWQTFNDLTKLKVKYQNISEEDDEGDYDEYKLNIPLIMLIDPRDSFGCPDCLDQGGYYIQFTLLGITRRFQIDKGHEPFYYNDLTKDIKYKIEKASVELKQYGR